jgi:hypothetical protein
MLASGSPANQAHLLCIRQTILLAHTMYLPTRKFADWTSPPGNRPWETALERQIWVRAAEPLWNNGVTARRWEFYLVYPLRAKLRRATRQ